MATVMTWGNSEGIQGRCDAKCHYARGPICHCMCIGRYHGRGLEPGGVQRVMREYGEQILEAAKKKAAKEGFALEAKDIGDLLMELGRK